MKGYPTRAFLICFGAYALSQLDLALFAYAIPSIRAEFDISLQGIALVVAVSYVIGGLLQVWMGHLTDRLGRKSILLTSTMVAPLFVAAHALAPAVWVLSLFRGGAIATGGAVYPVTGAIVTEETPARLRGVVAGLLQIGYPLGWFLASLFAASLLAAFGWRALFLVALLTIPYAIVVKLFLRETGRFNAQRKVRSDGEGGFRENVRLLFSAGYRRRVIILFAAQVLFVIAYGGSTFLLPTYFVESRDMHIGSSSLLVGLGNGIGVLGYILAAFVGEFVLTRRTTVVVWTLLGAAGFLAMIWGTHSFGGTLAAFGFMSMFFYGAAAVKFAFIAEIFPTRLRATGLAICGSLAVNLGIAIGPLIVAGLVERIGWNAAFSFAVAVPLVAAGLLYLLLRPVPSGLEVEDIEQRLSTSEK